MTFAMQLTPKGHLQFGVEPGAPLLPDALVDRLAAAFARGAEYGLLHLGAVEVATALPPLWAFGWDFAARYVTALTATPENGEIAIAKPDVPTLEILCLEAPSMTGAEYLTPSIFLAFRAKIDAAVKSELTAYGISLQDFLKSRHPAWNLTGRVHFNLAENRKDVEYPFAFLATYTVRLSAYRRAQHLSLSQAPAEFSGGRQKAQLLSLLVPVQRTAETCEWVTKMIANGELYYPCAGRFRKPSDF